MRHIDKSGKWSFVDTPEHRGFCFNWDGKYGHDKRDRLFLPVTGVTPVAQYTVYRYPRPLYLGTSKADAEEVWRKNRGGSDPNIHLYISGYVLPEGKFQIIKKKDGTALVVPTNDDTPRCLLFVGINGQAHQGLEFPGTTGEILYECSAGYNVDLSTEVVILLEDGESIELATSTREGRYFAFYEWRRRGLDCRIFFSGGSGRKEEVTIK